MKLSQDWIDENLVRKMFCNLTHLTDEEAIWGRIIYDW